MRQLKNQRVPSLEEIKTTLLLKAQLEDVANGETRGATTSKIADGINDIPVKKMIDQAQFLKENMLDRIKKKSGETSADYIFFKAVYDSLLWAIVVIDRYDALSGRYTRLKIFNQLTQENMAILDAELQKYITMEDFFLSDGLNIVARGIKARAEQLLKEK